MCNMLPREARDEWMKEMHEKLKLSMLKLIGECEIKSSYWSQNGIGGWCVTVHLFPDGDWKMAWGEEGVEGVSRSTTVGRLNDYDYCMSQLSTFVALSSQCSQWSRFGLAHSSPWSEKRGNSRASVGAKKFPQSQARWLPRVILARKVYRRSVKSFNCS